jgi:hypothetical protein
MPARAESTLARAERKRGIRCGIAVSLARDLRRRVSLRTRDAHRPALRVGGPRLAPGSTTGTSYAIGASAKRSPTFSASSAR